MISPTDWIESKLADNPQLNKTSLQKVCEYVDTHGGENQIIFAESVLSQGLAIADILLALNCDSPTVTAGILYPFFYYNQPTKETIENQFDQQIYKLLAGAQRIETIHSFSDSLQKNQTDNIRKMLLAMVDDIRIVLIKLAERLAILHYLKHVPEEYRKKIAEQAMYIYAPLANRLGIGHLKWQMEDLAFRYINPEKYQEISKSLKMRRKDRETFILEMKQQLETLFSEAKIKNFILSGRAKHIYSIYRKMQRKQVDFCEIYDTSAFRILVENINDCYTTLGVIHSTWNHIPKEFDDYIAKPKPNGYRSIHTAVIGPNNINVEIQIRTHAMHQEAELGVAAHWLYKESNQPKTSYENKINLLREMLDWQQEISVDKNGPGLEYSDIFKDRIYIFTPVGDIFDLEAGSTPLDFAYLIHSNIGNCCRGAKVNGQLVPLTHILKTGDQVQILTSKEGHPSRDWLNPNLGYIKSSHARAKIRHWFRKERYADHLAHGQEIWDKACRREDIKKSQLNDILNKLNFKNTNDLLAALGAGEIGIHTVINLIKGASQVELEQPVVTKIIKKPQKTRQTGFQIEGINNLLTQLARCCKPIPGDPIVGYITKGRGVSIHKASCFNIKKAMESHSQRILKVDWGSEIPSAYPVDLTVEANDRSGLIRDISNVIANENVSVIGINSRVNAIENIAVINLTIEIKHIDSLNKIIKLLRQVANVNRVSRR